jgi:hypothetical protein
MRKHPAILSAIFSALLVLGVLGSSAAPAAAQPAAAVQPLPADCNGYQPYSYPPSQNGDIVTGIGGCGFQAVTVELWIDISGGWDRQAACCTRSTSPVTAYGYCSRTGHGNYYTLTRTSIGDFESARRTLC